MDAVPGASIFIRSKDQNLHEYDDPSDSERPDTTICYIESIPDMPYTIHHELTPDFPYHEHDLSFRAYIDSQFVDKHTISLAEVAKRGLQASIVGGHERDRGQWIQRQLLFASQATSKSSCSDLGRCNADTPYSSEREAGPVNNGDPQET